MFSTYSVDIDALTDTLSSPRPLARTDANDSRVIEVPAPSGEIIAFTVEPVQVMEDGLAQAHPELRSFAGRGVDDPGVEIRADITPAGFHAMVRSADNSTPAWYVDPARRGDTGTYLSYPTGSLPEVPDGGTDKSSLLDDVESPQEGMPDGVGVPSEARVGAEVGVRTVRLALLNDPTYAAYFGSENVLGQKFSLINRVAGVYNDDLGVKLVLADGTDQLNFDTNDRAFGANGPCGEQACFSWNALANCNGETLSNNSSVIQQLLGNDAYDVGHVVLGNDGGGLAWLNVLGSEWWKGGGCTGTPKPQGDQFAIDYVAHEIGHQFGAEHTFNSCAGSPYIAYSQAVEPGSGSSILGYAGICGDDNLQRNSDPYLSTSSIDEIKNSLDWRISPDYTGNHVPTVEAPDDGYLPVRTPFALTAVGSDEDGSQLVYSWEQSNTGDAGRALRDAHKVDGPLFRMFGKQSSINGSQLYAGNQNQAGTSPTRTFPDLDQILAGATNAVTGTCDDSLDGWWKVECYSEFLPTSEYQGNGTDSLDFRVTARDLDNRGGGVSSDYVRLTLDQEAGPLLVTGFVDQAASLAGRSQQTLQWDVNGTDSEHLAPTVRILLSVDGGKTFPTVLADAVANDGSETFTIPNVDAQAARVKVEAVGGYFFAISPTDFAISRTVNPPTPGTELSSTDPASITVPVGSSVASIVTGQLPPTVTAHKGDEVFDLPVTWDTSGITSEALQSSGLLAVHGTATAAEGSLPAQLTILVTEAGERNFAPDAGVSASASFTEPGYSADWTRNGVLNDKAWSTWRGSGTVDEATLSYSFDSVHDVSGLAVRFYADGDTASWAQSLKVELRAADGTWFAAPGSEAPLTVSSPLDGSAPVVKLAFAPTASTGARVVMEARPGLYLVVSEVEIIEPVGVPASESSLAALRVDGASVSGFDPAALDYNVTSTGARYPVITAVPTDSSATATVAQASEEAGPVARVTVTSADSTVTRAYTVTFTRQVGVTDVAIGGEIQAGKVVSVSSTIDPADADITEYQWLLDGNPVESTLDGGKSLRIPADAANHVLSVSVSAAAEGFVSGEGRSLGSIVAAATPPNPGTPGDGGTSPSGEPSTGSGTGGAGGGSAGQSRTSDAPRALARTGWDAAPSEVAGFAAAALIATGAFLAMRRKRRTKRA